MHAVYCCLLLQNRHLLNKMEKHLHHKMSYTVAVAASGAEAKQLNIEHNNVQLHPVIH